MWAWYLEELRLKKYFDVVGEGEPLRIMHAIWWQPTRSSFSSHPYLEHQPSHRVHSSLFQRMVCFGVEVLLPELLPHWPTQLSHWPISRCSTTELTLPRYHSTPLLSSYHVFSPVIKKDSFSKNQLKWCLILAGPCFFHMVPRLFTIPIFAFHPTSGYLPPLALSSDSLRFCVLPPDQAIQ